MSLTKTNAEQTSDDIRAEWTVAQTGTVVFDLSNRDQVELRGADAVSFLHNLCTNDIQRLEPGQGCEIFLTNNKARIVAHGFAHRMLPSEPQVLFLDLDPGSASKVAAHLNRFIVSEQVEVADLSGSLALFHICGQSAEHVLKMAVPNLPALENLHHSQEDGVQIGRHNRLGLPGFDLICSSDQVGDIRKRLIAAGAALAGQEVFNVLRVEAGVPLDGIDMDSERFVVEVGRTKQAISYTKGCYLGQEPIVMARDRGHANRMLTGLRIESSDPLQPGDRVMRSGEEVGHVTSSVWSPLVGSAIAFAYVKRGNLEPGLALEVEGKKAVVSAVPFAVD